MAQSKNTNKLIMTANAFPYIIAKLVEAGYTPFYINGKKYNPNLEHEAGGWTVVFCPKGSTDYSVTVDFIDDDQVDEVMVCFHGEYGGREYTNVKKILVVAIEVCENCEIEFKYSSPGPVKMRK